MQYVSLLFIIKIIIFIIVWNQLFFEYCGFCHILYCKEMLNNICIVIVSGLHKVRVGWFSLNLKDHLKPQQYSQHKVKVAQWCLTLCESPWNSPGQSTEMGSLSLIQGISPIQGSKPGLPHCRWILYQLSHKGGPRILEWIAYPFSRGSSNPGTEPGFLALQVDSLPTEPHGKPISQGKFQYQMKCSGKDWTTMRWR